jgi:hypothetical protein
VQWPEGRSFNGRLCASSANFLPHAKGRRGTWTHVKLQFLAAALVSHGESPFIPRSLLFRTIRASWSDNDCLVMAGRQAVDILQGSPPESPSNMASKRLWNAKLWRDAAADCGVVCRPSNRWRQRTVVHAIGLDHAHQRVMADRPMRIAEMVHAGRSSRRGPARNAPPCLDAQRTGIGGAALPALHAEGQHRRRPPAR